MINIKTDAKEIIIKLHKIIFTRFGFHKTTKNKIAKALYKAKNLIYHYFKNKEQIFHAFAGKKIQVFENKIIKEINKKHKPQEKLYALIND